MATIFILGNLFVNKHYYYEKKIVFCSIFVIRVLFECFIIDLEWLFTFWKSNFFPSCAHQNYDVFIIPHFITAKRKLLHHSLLFLNVYLCFAKVKLVVIPISHRKSVIFIILHFIKPKMSLWIIDYCFSMIVNVL